MVGHAREERDAVALHDLEGVLGREARQQREASRPRRSSRSGCRSGRRSGRAAARRARRRRARIGTQLRHHDRAVDEEVRVGELGALRLARRARGVEDHRGVGGAASGAAPRSARAAASSARVSAPAPPAHDHGHARRRRARARRLLEERVRDQQARARVLQVVLHLGRREQHVERHHGAARVEDPEVGDRELGQVRDQ